MMDRTGQKNLSIVQDALSYNNSIRSGSKQGWANRSGSNFNIINHTPNFKIGQENKRTSQTSN